MPRNGSGSYTLPEAAFVPNTAISSSAVNSDFSDIASALTGSLARDGQGGMTAVLPLANLGFTYLNDPNTGIRRTASDTQAISCGSVDTVSITSTGVEVTGSLAVSGAFTVGGAVLLPIGLGPLPWSGLTAPSKWLLCYGQTLLRADYPDLWTFISAEIAGGNTLFTNGNGSTTFTMPDMRGRVAAGKDNMGGSAASRLTVTTMTPDGNTLGAISSNTSQTVSLAANQIPTLTSVNASQSITVGNASQHIPAANSNWAQSNNFNTTGVTTGAFTAGSVGDLTTITGTNSISVTYTNASQQNVANVQPTIITNYIIYAGA